MQLQVRTFVDGLNDGAAVSKLHLAIAKTWRAHYGALPVPNFLPSLNMKGQEHAGAMSPILTTVSSIRNPDIYLFEESRSIDLGGVEITTHSPDGSNIEKRYPFIWAARRCGIAAFIATPYAKRRPGGQVNRLPHRHSQRNRSFAETWNPAVGSPIQQILPISELTENDIQLPDEIRNSIWTWNKIGEYFAHALAFKVLDGRNKTIAEAELRALKLSLITLADACIANTTDTEASSLIRINKRWIQIYNSRPDSGHWERGEGQFDSIDGRLMFTHDAVELIRPIDRPTSLEFWLPQMVSEHAWIKEQVQRGYGSKRLRNLLITLRPYVFTKFADDLTPGDWNVLQSNPRLLLEQLDWNSGLYSIKDVLRGRSTATISRNGLSNTTQAEVDRIRAILERPMLWFSTHRAYEQGWELTMERAISTLPPGATILAPRIPGHLLKALSYPSSTVIKAAEACSKDELRALRQIFRSTSR